MYGVPSTCGKSEPSPYPSPSMYNIGSARLPSIDGIASLRQTIKLRRQTWKKRGLRRGGTKSLACRISVAQIPAGQFQEHILEIGASMQVARLLTVAERRQHAVIVTNVAEHRLTDALEAIAHQLA